MNEAFLLRFEYSFGRGALIFGSKDSDESPKKSSFSEALEHELLFIGRLIMTLGR